MVTRAYDFDSGIETPAAPAISPPVAPGDVVTIGAKTRFTIVNNHVAADITGLVFDKTVYRSFLITYTIFRSSVGGFTRAETGTIKGITDGTNWEIYPDSVTCPNTGDAGITFTITSAGQVQYASDDNTGAYDATKSVFDWELLQLMAI